jgi:hypothetical protein
LFFNGIFWREGNKGVKEIKKRRNGERNGDSSDILKKYDWNKEEGGEYDKDTKGEEKRGRGMKKRKKSVPVEFDGLHALVQL